MAANETIPTSVAGLDAAWLNEALLPLQPDHPGVATARTEPMPGIVGALGEVGLVHITWEGDTDLPSTMVAKCPLDDDMARLYNSVMQNYTREAGFYRDLASEVPMRVPRCFVNAESGAKDSHMLLIEKIEGIDGDILQGTDFDTMVELVTKMAKMHGQFWMSDDIANLPWMLDWNAESLKLGIPITQESWSAFQTAEPSVYSDELKAFCEAGWINDTEHWLDLYTARPWTFTHMDYELDNTITTPDETVILDWQTCLKSLPGTDLAWLLSSSSNNTEIVERESELIDHYRKVLHESGGPDWSHDRVIEDLAWGVLYPTACQPVPNTQPVAGEGAAADRARARFRAFLDRAVDAAERWDLVGHCSGELRG